jgi:hypothetical protein
MAQKKNEALLALLTKHLPKHRKKDGTVSLRKVALGIGISKQAVSQWPIRGTIPSRRVKKLINLPGSTLTRDLLLPFVDLG